MKLGRFFLVICCLLVSSTLFALTLPSPHRGDNIVGRVKTIHIPSGANITSLGQRYDVGYLEFFEANPKINLRHLSAHEPLVVPTQFILPNVPHRGIVINVAELRLYYFPPGKHYVMTFPIGVGRKRLGSETPTIRSKITQKRKNPIWRPTDDTRLEARQMGITLPPYIDAGPENPLGDYAMRLGSTPYLIHGTNNPSGVGIRSSGGCIRMFPSNVEALFHVVKLGTPVNIVDEPFKAGFLGHTLYLEAHVPIDKKRGRTHRTLSQASKVLMPFVKKYHAKIDWEKVLHVANEQHGVPEPVGYR